jgi:hypothetical protein
MEIILDGQGMLRLHLAHLIAALLPKIQFLPIISMIARFEREKLFDVIGVRMRARLVVVVPLPRVDFGAGREGEVLGLEVAGLEGLFPCGCGVGCGVAVVGFLGEVSS